MSLALRARLALAAATFAAALALTADRADAAFTPAVKDRTLLVTGDATSEKLALRVPPNAPTTLEIDVGDNGSAEFKLPRAGFDRIRVLAGDGADRVRIDDAGVRGVTAPPTTIEGQGGADTLIGGRSADTLNGGDGNDLIEGTGGSDSADGGAGFDRLSFNGSAGADQIRLTADGTRARLTRDVGATALGSSGVERIDIAPLGGDDTLTLGDVEGTGVQEVHPDLAGGSDRLILDGTSGDDFVSAIGTTAGRTSVVGLPAFVDVVNADPANDELTINGLAGKDQIDAGGAATAFRLVADGGAGADTLSGGTGADTLTGGDGNDFVEGRRGADVVNLGAGDDAVSLRAGDGRDTVEGEAGNDSVRFSGTSAGEQIDVSAAGQRTRLSTAGAVAVDAGGVELLSVFSFGGADRLVVGDLSGSGLTVVDVSLFDFGVPGGDQDVVRIDGTGADDGITAAGDASVVSVTGLSAKVRITGTAAAGDRLEVNGLAGEDTIDSTGLPVAEMRFLADGGAGNDVLLGGDGDDVLSGGDGADVVFAGAATTSASAAPATMSCAARRATTSSTAASATTSSSVAPATTSSSAARWCSTTEAQPSATGGPRTPRPSRARPMGGGVLSSTSLSATWAIKRFGAAPCQWSSSGAKTTRSPGRMISTGPPRA